MFFSVGNTAYAASTKTSCESGGTPGTWTGKDVTNLETNGTCACPASTSQDNGGVCVKGGNAAAGQKIYDWLTLFINFLSAIVGIIVVGSIIWAGIQYSSASADPQKVSAAKNRIKNAVLALVAYLFIYAFLNYLIPGGLFK
jgi:hypothetical protein